MFGREFKLSALARMEAGANVSALARELGVRRKYLYQWRERFRLGGPVALRSRGRPTKAEQLAMESGSPEALPAASPVMPAAAPLTSWLWRGGGSRSWSARSASSKLNWIFFGKPCGKSGKHAGRTTGLACGRLRGHRGDDVTAAARRAHGRADVWVGGGQPGGLLPPVAGLRAAAGRDRGARRDPTGGAGEPSLWLSADRGPAAAREAWWRTTSGCCG